MAGSRGAALAILVPLGLGAACRADHEAPPRPVPAALAVVGDLPATAIVGTTGGTLAVRVTDAAGRPLSGILVHFAPTRGGGRVAPAADTTAADGTAATVLTVATTPGVNEVGAAVSGLDQVKSAILTGTAGATETIGVSPRRVRFSESQDSLMVSAIPRDAFGNVVATATEWTSRNSALVSVSGTGGASAVIRVVGRPGQTWLVATGDGVSDSLPVAVHDATSTPCDFIVPPVTLAVGGTATFEAAGLACMRADAAGAEFRLAVHYNTAISIANGSATVLALGVSPPSVSSAMPSAAATRVERAPPDRHHAFERSLRERERREVGRHLPSAREWFRSRSAAAGGGGRARFSAAARIGDVVDVNVNAFDFCRSPSMRTARVAAMTDGTMILADVFNPAGGFSDEEYREFAMTMDTLVTPVDTAAFGAPSDIDGDGRVAILFTRAVNELTPRGAGGGVVLGFFYQRDLLPRVGPFASCPGSNQSEMFYMLVPDPDGAVSDARSKAFVRGATVSTIAHEFQHLINASRRMYVNDAPQVSEEVWLDEGLSHIAEELVFYRASKLGPRQNIGAGDLAAGSDPRVSLDLYQRGNFGRYEQFLRATATTSPVGLNDGLATRGAAWAFLRYVADRAGTVDGDFWRRLVNARTTGTVNLDAALSGTGLTTMQALRDWSVAVVAYDIAGGVIPALTQPSWDFATAMPETGFAFALTAPAIPNGVSTFLPLRGGGTAYLRFAVAPDQEALLQASGAGGALPAAGIRLTVVRIK